MCWRYGQSGRCFPQSETFFKLIGIQHTRHLQVSSLTTVCAMDNSSRLENCLKYGFAVGSEDMEPYCVVCKKSFSTSSLVPSKMKLHLQRRHPALADSPKSYFRLLYDQDCSGSPPPNYQKFAYETGLLIAKGERPHTIAKTFGVPFLESYTRNILGKDFEYSTKLCLSNKSISRRIKVMAADVERQIVRILQQTNFALQLDETLTHGNEALLMVYVRFVSPTKNALCDEFLFSDFLGVNATAEAIFNALSAYLVSNDIPFANIIGCTTDGAPAMVGRHSGFISRLKTKAPHIIAIHCALHRENLVAKHLHPALDEAMRVVVQVVNHIKGKPKCNRIFQQLCADEGENFVNLLQFTQIRWLSRGKCLTRFVNLYDTVCECTKELPQFACLRSADMKARIFYMADVFELLNKLNVSLQGTQTTLIDCKRKVNAFIDMTKVWKEQVEEGNWQSFAFLQSLAENLPRNLLNIMASHLNYLADEFNDR